MKVSLDLPAADNIAVESMQQPNICAGVPLTWPLAQFFQTYPFSRHDECGTLLGFRLSSVDPITSQFRIQTETCILEKRLVLSGGTCIECVQLTKSIDHIIQKAEHAEPFTNYCYLSSLQLQTVAREKDKTKQSLQLQVWTSTHF